MTSDAIGNGFGGAMIWDISTSSMTNYEKANYLTYVANAEYPQKVNNVFYDSIFGN